MQNEQDLLKMEVVFMEKESYLENNTKEGKNNSDVIFVGIKCINLRKPCITIRIRDCINNKDVEVDILRTNMTPAVVDKVISENNGVSIDPEATCKYLLDNYNHELMNGAPNVSRWHTDLGWKLQDDNMVFYGNEAISKESSVGSSYDGSIDIKPMGNINTISKMISNNIHSEVWSPLEAIIAFGVGSTVLAYANIKWKMSFNNIILHLLGGSTTGKTTALNLFSGLGSNPNSKHGFAINYASTEGSIIKRIGQNNGYPVSVDEISAGNRKSYESFVYTIGNGEEKDRLKPGGVGLQESVTFQTVVLSSGEVSLLKKCSKNEGLRARCIEFSNISWTSSKEQSNAIKACMKNNYGLVTPAIAKELITNDGSWRERLSFWQKEVESKISEDKILISIGSRVADYVALFATSAEIANDVLGINLDVDRIFKFCYEYIIIANAEEANIGSRAYEAIIEFISLNKEKFADATFYGGARSFYDDITLDVNYSGFFYEATRKKTIGEYVYDTVYVFRMGILENVLADAGFADAKVVLHKLKENGYLKTNAKKDKSYRSYYTINGSSQPCHALYFRDESMSGRKFD